MAVIEAYNNLFGQKRATFAFYSLFTELRAVRIHGNTSLLMMQPLICSALLFSAMLHSKLANLQLTLNLESTILAIAFC